MFKGTKSSIIKLYAVIVSLAFPFLSYEILVFLLSVSDLTGFWKFLEKSNMDVMKAFSRLMDIKFKSKVEKCDSFYAEIVFHI